MSRKPHDAVLSLVLLFVATLGISLLVGLGRHWLTGAAPGVEPVSQEMRSLLGSTAVFTSEGRDLLNALPGDRGPFSEVSQSFTWAEPYPGG